MRIYAAHNAASPNEGVLNETAYPWILVAFKGSPDPRALTYRPALLIDSGAFSVWTQGRTVDLSEYVAWALALREEWGGELRVINLDVIPGAFTGVPTEVERLRAAEKSAVNAEAIRAAGLPVVEVFHRYEPLYLLDEILERRQPGEIVAVGGLVGRAGGRRGKEEFCDSVFARIRDWGDGWDGLVPVHGLGVSGDAPLARRYPWFSVDASTWQTGRNFNLHVQQSGAFKPRNRATAPRTTPEMTALFMRRRLDRWLRFERSLTQLWEGRGVRFLEEELAAA